MTAGPNPSPGTALVDAHCHIDLYPDPAAIVREAEAAGVHTVAVTNAPSVFFHTQALAAGSRHLHPAVGLHPQLVSARAAELTQMWPLLQQTRFVGEVGLDYVTKDERDRRLQREVFGSILERCAASKDKILTVHSRRAAKDVLAAIGTSFPGAIILHWFSGTVQELEQAVRSGLHFSVNPAMAQSTSGRNLIARMPRDRVLTETDGPFVTAGDEPARPPHVASVVGCLAEIWGVTPDVARAAVSGNFLDLLDDKSRPSEAPPRS